MTSVCVGGGPSQGKASFGLSVYMSGAALAARFANTASWLSVFLASYIAGVAYELSSFCTSDPPAVPTLAASDFVALLQVLDPVARLNAQTKIQQWIGAMVWYDLCECVSGAQPAAPAPAAPPVGLPTVNPPLPGFPAPNVPCLIRTHPNQSAIGGNSGIEPANNDDLRQPTAIDLRIPMTVTVAPGTSTNWTIVYHQWPIPGAVLRTDTFTVTAAQNFRRIFSCPPGTGQVEIFWTAPAGPGTSAYNYEADFYCGGQLPGAQQSPCCPPDPALLAQIDRILETVTLIQRQAVPFAYVPGTAHAGLAGAGAFGISGILGVKIAVTTLPTPIGREGSSPMELFDAGFVTFGTADGYPSSFRLEHDPQVILPSRCSAFTEFAYDLHPGVVVTVTELLREP